VHNRFIPFRGRIRYVLEDDTVVLGCADCPLGAVVGTAGDILKHRMQEHGAGKAPGGRAPKDPAKDAGEDREPSELAWMGWTLGEVVELAYHLTGAEADAERWRERYEQEHELRVAAEKELKAITRKITRLVGGK
jgi:hypothetical protein